MSLRQNLGPCDVPLPQRPGQQRRQESADGERERLIEQESVHRGAEQRGIHPAPVRHPPQSQIRTDENGNRRDAVHEREEKQLGGHEQVKDRRVHRNSPISEEVLHEGVHQKCAEVGDHDHQPRKHVGTSRDLSERIDHQEFPRHVALRMEWPILPHAIEVHERCVGVVALRDVEKGVGAVADEDYLEGVKSQRSQDGLKRHGKQYPDEHGPPRVAPGDPSREHEQARGCGYRHPRQQDANIEGLKVSVYPAALGRSQNDRLGGDAITGQRRNEQGDHQPGPQQPFGYLPGCSRHSARGPIAGIVSGWHAMRDGK